MYLFVNGATKTVDKFQGHEHLGRLVQPRSWNNLEDLANSGMPYGADNDALKGIDPLAIVKMWSALAKVKNDNLKFVTAPDAVEMTEDGPHGDWNGTLWMWKGWKKSLKDLGLPAAIVTQDGASVDTVPWDDIAALFIGGSTAWKFSKTSALLIRVAAHRGKWVHVGRVNSMKRLRYLDGLPVDSFDGGQFSMYPDTYIPKYLDRLTVKQEGFLHAI